MKVFCLVFCIFNLIFSAQSFAEEVIENDDYQLDLDKIVVTASKLEQLYRNVPENISILSSQDIDDADTIEISDLLDLLPSINILEYGSLGSTRSIQARGASNNQVLTMIDGRPINTARDGLADFNQISLSNIERIEVLRGPAATMHGANAIGGVVNVISKTGKEEMSTELTEKFGSFRTNFSSFSHGWKIKDFDYFVSYDYLSSLGHRDNSQYMSHNINTNLGYEVNEGNHVRLSKGYYKSRSGSPGRIENQDLDDKLLKKKEFTDLTWDGQILDDQNILVKIYHDSDSFEFVETPRPLDNSINQTDVYGMDAQFSQVWFDVFRTTFGGGYKYNTLNSTKSGDREYNAKDLYVETETDLFDNIICKFGARWDDYSNFGDRISPSGSFAVWILDTIKLHGLVAKSYRVPTFNDLYWPSEDWGARGGVEGNPNLEPENSFSYEIGMGGYVFKSFKADVTYFVSKVDDLIEWTMDDSFWWRPTNVGKALIRGIEAEAEYIIRKNLKANFNYTLLNARDSDSDNYLIYRPKQIFKCNLTYRPISKIKIGLSGRYVSKRYTNTSNTRTLPPYFTMDFELAYDLNENWELLGRTDNIFNRKFQEQEGYSIPGQTFMLGSKVKF